MALGGRRPGAGKFFCADGHRRITDQRASFDSGQFDLRQIARRHAGRRNPASRLPRVGQLKADPPRNGVFDGTLFRRVANVHTDNTFHVSTSFLSQGSMAPAPFDGVAFPEFNTGTGQIDVKVTTAGKLYRTNGTTISVPTSTTSFK